MSISYPINVPSNKNPINTTFTAQSVVGVSSSPFSGVSQVYVHQGQWWGIQVDLPPMTRADAEQWIAFALKLNGREGYFRIGDYDAQTPRGTVSTSINVDGASQVGNELDVKNMGVGKTLLTGDWIQIGDYMYKVLDDATADASGEASLTIWPNLRSSPSDSATITTSNCKSVFRMSSNTCTWDTNSLSHYGIVFVAQEKL